MTIENCSVTGNLANENARLKETIAAQAVVIEKLREALEATKPHVQCDPYAVVLRALAIPTDSKEVLKAWLDEVLGEPVGYMSNESAYRLKHGGNSKGAVPVHLTPSSVSKIPLFRKPEVK